MKKGKLRKVIVSLVTASLVVSMGTATLSFEPVSYAAGTSAKTATQAPGTASWSIEAMHIAEAHQAGYTGKHVKIALLDSGISLPAAGNIAGGVSFVGDQADHYIDNYGQGTYVAGIAGTWSHGTGVGIAPEAELYAVKVIDQDGTSSIANVIKGIKWAIAHDIEIMYIGPSVSTGSPEYAAAIAEAYSKGITIVAPAGNTGNAGGSGDSIGYPAAYSEVIAVGSVDERMQRASDSSTGSNIEFTAPGVAVSSTGKSGGDEIRNGTSTAAAHVTGFLALLKQMYPKYSNIQLRNELQHHAVDLGATGRDPLYGYGFVSYMAAPYVKNEEGTADTTPPDKVSSISAINITDTTAELKWTNPPQADFDHVNVYRKGTTVGQSVYEDHYLLTGLTANTTYSYLVTTVDKTGNESAGAGTEFTTKVSTVPPVVDQGVMDVSNLQVIDTAHNFIKVSWTKSTSTDTASVYLDGRWIGETTSDFYTFTGLNPQVNYEMTVRAKRSDGALSPGLKVTAMTKETPDDRKNTREVSSLRLSETYENSLEIEYKIPSQVEKVKIYVDGDYVGSTKKGYYEITGLKSVRRYEILVTTVNSDGYESKGVKLSARTNNYSSGSSSSRDLTRAREKVTDAEDSLRRSDWLDAQEEVEDLSDGLNKDALLRRLNRIKNQVYSGSSNSTSSSNSSTTQRWSSNAAQEIILQLGLRNALINSQYVTIPQMPVIQNGTTLVPLRFVSETAGYKVSYNHRQKKITLQKPDGSREVKLGVGEKLLVVSDEDVLKSYSMPIIQAPIIQDGYTMVPFRVISEATGYVVKYDADTRRITLTK